VPPAASPPDQGEAAAPPGAKAPPPPEEFAEKVACPHCGDTNSHWLPDKGVMRCDTCRSTFQLDAQGVAHIVNDDVAGLRGTELSAGAGQDVDAAEAEDQVYTFRCPTCGAEVVVQAAANLATVKCHWCRNTLTWSDRINNGAKPDGIVPFALTREQAKAKMQAFLKRRRAFANRKFLAEYSLENIQPVYFPYFMVDINAKADHAGQAAHLVRKYTKGSDNNKTTYYDYDVYAFQRRFDLYVNDLLVPSNADFANLDNQLNTNNIINSVAPWHTASVVPYSPQYLQGEYRAERRSSNVGQIRPQVMNQVMDISHIQANQTMRFYDHGIAYQHDDLQVQGERWVTLLCPVWLYSYLEVKKGKRMLHYIAVNGTTGETMGSVPTNKARMLVVAAIAEVIGIIGAALWWVFAG